MTGAAHASMGAALGALIKKPALAFAAGMLSHIIADSVPHKDLTVKQEVAAMGITIGYIAVRHGLKSPEFCGALGAICPDFEHGLTELGIIPKKRESFPTHISDGKYHGRESKERISQALTFIACIAIAERSNP
jgi:hypothetical protein